VSTFPPPPHSALAVSSFTWPEDFCWQEVGAESSKAAETTGSEECVWRRVGCECVGDLVRSKRRRLRRLGGGGRAEKDEEKEGRTFPRSDNLSLCLFGARSSLSRAQSLPLAHSRPILSARVSRQPALRASQTSGLLARSQPHSQSVTPKLRRTTSHSLSLCLSRASQPVSEQRPKQQANRKRRRLN